ncbi:hypothetical protein [Antarcticibacterium sp. 1MA-6-2]|nr:hypothetical protein [Antarcticibacterium sp. 1MA-6-2]
MEVGSRKYEVRKAGSWKIEDRSWKFEAESSSVQMHLSLGPSG